MANSDNRCANCRQDPVHSHCGICRRALCRKCEQYLETDAFSFREKVPAELTQGFYCAPCFHERLEPEMARYQEVLARARAVFIFSQASPRTMLKKSNKGISVPQCKDRDETYLRLGFRAAEQGFNAVVETVVERTRQRNIWRGEGIPARIDTARQERFE